MLASLNSRCASSKKNTSFGLSASPISGSWWYSSASIHIMKVENSAGRSWTSDSSRTLMRPRPSDAGSIRSATSNSGSPNSAPAPCCSSCTISRSNTPTDAFEMPP